MTHDDPTADPFHSHDAPDDMTPNTNEPDQDGEEEDRGNADGA